MMKVKIGLFYRDGANYKCNWDVEIDRSVLNELVGEDEDIMSYVDSDYRSENLFSIYDIGLSVSDIPIIKEYGYDSEHDHNFISITSIEEVD